jgi:transcription factor S
MMFCPKCGSLLRSKIVKNKTVMGCDCGYVSKDSETSIKETVKQDEKEIEIIDKELNIYPLVSETCPECGHKKAFFMSAQTRAGDEPETNFFKCEKCKHSWRDYK